jgi:hypothetical protein
VEAPNPSSDDQPPGVPTRGVILLAFAGVVVAGLLGALAAYGIVDVDCRGGCGTNAELAAVVGALIGTIGGGIVAVLVLRARALWRVPLDDVPQDAVPQDAMPQDDGYENDG